MNAKAAGIVGIIIAIIVGIGLIYAISDSSMNPTDSNVEVGSNVEVDSSTNLNSDSESSPAINDDVTITTGNQNYTVDDEGKRHYSIVAKTEPIMKSTP